jgi:hypothetical protein
MTTSGGVEQRDTQYLWPRLSKDSRVAAGSGGRTVAHVFDLATHKDDERAVRESLHESLAPGLVLTGRNAWGEFIPFDWENRSEYAGEGRELAD